MVERVQRLSNAMMSIPGVRTASVNKHDVSELTISDLSLPPYADLPLAVLRRSEGGLPCELLIAIEFELDGGTAGLLALEFLSWWVRDAARGGAPMQLRSLALPPLEQQFGQTLRFQIDWFHSDPEQDIERLLTAVDALAADLEASLEHYAIERQIKAGAARAAHTTDTRFLSRLRGLFAG